MAWQAALPLVGNIIEGKFSRDQARKQMRFQEDMSNTAYQRAMEDMRKAGLNPILAGKLGGASTPPGSMAKTPDFGGTTAKAIANKQLRALQESQIGLQTAQGSSVRNQGFYYNELGNSERIKQQGYLQDNINKQITNQLGHAKVDYFRQKGYPPEVLTARVQNIVGTELWEKMPPSTKQAIIGSFYQVADKGSQGMGYILKNPYSIIPILTMYMGAPLAKKVVDMYIKNKGGSLGKPKKGK